MTNTIFPTAYLPSIALMAAIVRHDKIVIELHETFPKQTHRNRTVIGTANGPMTLSVPVVRPQGNHTETADIKISYSEKWNVIHWRAIESAYNSSPYFLYYRDGIEKILKQPYEHLTEMNEELLKYLLKCLKHPCEIEYSNEYFGTNKYDSDYRDLYSYKHPERNPKCPEYTQVFCDRHQFNSNISILDTLFNLGPETAEYLLKIEA